MQGIVTKHEDKQSDATVIKEIAEFDIVRLTETHTVEGLSDIHVNGYKTISFHRP